MEEPASPLSKLVLPRSSNSFSQSALSATKRSIEVAKVESAGVRSMKEYSYTSDTLSSVVIYS